MPSGFRRPLHKRVEDILTQTHTYIYIKTNKQVNLFLKGRTCHHPFLLQGGRCLHRRFNLQTVSQQRGVSFSISITHICGKRLRASFSCCEESLNLAVWHLQWKDRNANSTNTSISLLAWKYYGAHAFEFEETQLHIHQSCMIFHTFNYKELQLKSTIDTDPYPFYFFKDMK